MNLTLQPKQIAKQTLKGTSFNVQDFNCGLERFRFYLLKIV